MQGLNKLKDKIKAFFYKNKYKIIIGFCILAVLILSDAFNNTVGKNSVNNQIKKDISIYEKKNCLTFNSWGYPKNEDEKEKDFLYLCRLSYFSQYDKVNKVPKYVSEYMEKQHLIGSQLSEINFIGYMYDKDIPNKMQIDLDGYKNTIYSPLALAPIENLYYKSEYKSKKELIIINQQSIDEGFYTTNTAPMNKYLKYGLWKILEDNTKKLLDKENRRILYVITGSIYLNDKDLGILGGARIPTHYYKIIVDPDTSGSNTYIIPNKEIKFNSNQKMYTNNYEDCGNYCELKNFSIQFKELERITKYEFFPNLSPYYAAQIKLNKDEFYKLYNKK